MHLGRPAQDIPFLWELSDQIQKAVDFLLALDRFQHLTTRFSDRPNPRAIRLHYALADLEETVMTDMVETVQEILRCSINSFMCDGASASPKIACHNYTGSLSRLGPDMV